MTLNQYLQDNYPQGSKEYYAMALVFVNNYNASLKREYAEFVSNTDKIVYAKCISAELFGSTTYGVYEWLMLLDRKLFDLAHQHNGNSYTVMSDYFGMSVASERESISKLRLLLNPTPPKVIYKNLSSNKFSSKRTENEEVEYKLCVTKCSVYYNNDDFGKEFFHTVSPNQTKKQIFDYLLQLFNKF